MNLPDCPDCGKRTELLSINPNSGKRIVRCNKCKKTFVSTPIYDEKIGFVEWNKNKQKWEPKDNQ